MRLKAIVFVYTTITVLQYTARALSVMSKRKQATETGILMILSPAKTLDLSPTDRLSADWTSPDCNVDKTKTVATALKKRKTKELEKLLGISANLAKTAHEYWSAFEFDPSTRSDLKPCIFSFSGAAYQGLQASECSDDAIQYLQRNLRVIDPLYGSLRPLDVLQPYRLEMATKKTFPQDDKLKMAEYWKPSVCDFLSKDLAPRDNKILLNLASDEYSAAVDESSLPEGTQYIKIVFREEGRTIAVHAKRARGLMVRYLAENAIQNLEAVQDFDVEGYSFVKDKSDETTFVFDRKKQPKKVAAKKKTAATKKASTTKKAEPAKKRTRRR